MKADNYHDCGHRPRIHDKRKRLQEAIEKEKLDVAEFNRIKTAELQEEKTRIAELERENAELRELLTEIRDGEVNPECEADKFLRNVEKSKLSEVMAENAELRGKLAATASALTKTKANMEEMERNLYLKLQAQEADGERLDEAYELAIAELREKLAGMEEERDQWERQCLALKLSEEKSIKEYDDLAAENARLRDCLALPLIRDGNNF
jgi:hypothetical protein